jgi:1-acyl-sn-glycerol-3-phosphate acyltransferase
VIPAAPSRWFSRWFARDVERRIAKTFGRVLVHGLDAVLAAGRDAPLLVVSNHTSWWDPLVTIHLFRRGPILDGYAMMDEKNLRALPFFRKLGAFGVRLGDPADGARAIRYAAGLLDRPGRVVWIFAQGREVPITVRPLAFRGGAAAIARIARRAACIPCALRYEFGERPKPDLYVSFGEPAPALATGALEDAVARELVRIDAAIVARDEAGFARVLTARESLLFVWAQRALARLARLPEG